MIQNNQGKRKCASGRCNCPAVINEVALTFGLKTPSRAELVAGRAIAAGLINPNISDVDAFERVQAITGSSVFGYVEGGDVQGMLSFFPVNLHGYDALRNGTFDGVNPPDALIARPGEVVHAGYAWGIAATSKAGARAIMGASAYLLEHLYWDIPFYSRVATEDGKRAMIGALGFQPVAGDATGLVVHHPTPNRVAA